MGIRISQWLSGCCGGQASSPNSPASFEGCLSFLMLQGQTRCAVTCIGARQIPLSGTAEYAEERRGTALRSTANSGAVLRVLCDLCGTNALVVMLVRRPAAAPRTHGRRAAKNKNGPSLRLLVGAEWSFPCKSNMAVSWSRHRSGPPGIAQPRGAIGVIRPFPGNP